MATIKEMAENIYYPTLAEKAAYWDGANAVLKEIENVLKADSILGNPFPTTEMRLRYIEDKIKELKED